MAPPLQFTVYFDGTGNNKDLHTPEGTHTNVARLYELDTAKGTNLAYNSGPMPQKYVANDRSGESEKIYFDGVGSQAGISPKVALEAGTGMGGQARIDDAYQAIVGFHNKNPGTEVQVNIVGFSRGAAQARALANEFIKKGVPELGSAGKPSGSYLIEPGKGKVNKLAIFDTVASYGNALSDSHIGKDLQIHPNVQSTTHLVAMNEYRKTFRLTSALRNDNNERIEELQFAGAHSQIGGGYRNDDLAAGPLAVMHQRLASAGVKLSPLREEDRQRVERYNQLIQDPKLVQSALIDSRLKHGNDAFKQGADGSLEKVNNQPFVLEKGTVNPLRRQAKPFDHDVSGRGVVFELDDSFSKTILEKVKEGVGKKFNELGARAKNHANEFLGRRDKQVSANLVEDAIFEKYQQRVQKASQEKISTLSQSLSSSRPDATYLSNLKLPQAPQPEASSEKGAALDAAKQPAAKPTVPSVQQLKKSERTLSFEHDSPGDAVKKHPELVGAYAAAAAIDKKVATDNLTPQQRAFVQARVQQNIAKSIERGEVPSVQQREEITIKRDAVEEKEFSR